MRRLLLSKYKYEKGDLKSLSPCSECAHKFEDAIGCRAFPSKIPDDILNRKHDHKRPHFGDNKIQFKQQA